MALRPSRITASANNRGVNRIPKSPNAFRVICSARSAGVKRLHGDGDCGQKRAAAIGDRASDGARSRRLRVCVKQRLDEQADSQKRKPKRMR